MQTELSKHQCKNSRLEIWQRGVDTDQFNPRFRCREQRSNMTNGNPDAPLLIHVGRLGAGAFRVLHVAILSMKVFMPVKRGVKEAPALPMDSLPMEFHTAERLAVSVCVYIAVLCS